MPPKKIPKRKATKPKLPVVTVQTFRNDAEGFARFDRLLDAMTKEPAIQAKRKKRRGIDTNDTFDD